MDKDFWNKYAMPPEADQFLDEVKEEFAQSFEVKDKFLSGWLKHHNVTKGKWIRARLALATGGLLGLSYQTVTKWAIVCELIHSASLLHDDICDQDTMRRGKTAVWKEFGVPAAICSGDYLIAESFRKLTEIEQGWHQNILLKLLSNSVKAIVFGQSLDVSYEHLTINKQQYKDIAIEKTSPLISMPMMGMFRCKELSDLECDALEEISKEFGYAYQCLNDMENLYGKEQEAYSDLTKSHPNIIVINVLNEQSEDFNSQIKKNPSKLIKLIEKKHYLNCIIEIKNTLNEADKIMHRLPIIIRPILESLKNEMLMRIKKI
jgi:geranylgeranyl diphosphate synthase type I